MHDVRQLPLIEYVGFCKRRLPDGQGCFILRLRLTRVPPAFSGWHKSWRFAAAGLALPEKEHTSMIKFLKTAITRGPDLLRTRPASSPTVWPGETPSTPRAEPGIQGLKNWGRNLSRNV